MRSKNRFERGSGCYQCQSCGRTTRSTGRGDNEHVKLCAECFDLSGIENTFHDSKEPYDADLIAEARRLYLEITSKGGKYRPDFPDIILPASEKKA